jgi:hypothetical protein
MNDTGTSRLTSRVDVLEHSFGELKTVVREQGLKTDETIRELGKTLHRFMDHVREQPRAWPVKEMLATFVATATLFTILMTGANAWLGYNLAPDRQTLERVSNDTNNLAVVKYRLEQLEKNTGSTLRP